MTKVSVIRDPVTGDATISLQGMAFVDPMFRIRNVHDNSYLGREGWVPTFSKLPADFFQDGQDTEVTIPAKYAAMIAEGQKISFEEPGNSYRVDLTWPPLPVNPSPEIGDIPGDATRSNSVARPARRFGVGSLTTAVVIGAIMSGAPLMYLRHHDRVAQERAAITINEAKLNADATMAAQKKQIVLAAAAKTDLLTRIEQITTQLTDARQNLTETQASLAEARDQSKEASDEIARMKSQIATLTGDLLSTTMELASARDTKSSLLNKINLLETQLATPEPTMAAEIASLSNERDTYKRQAWSTTNAYNDTLMEIGKLKRENAALSKKILANADPGKGKSEDPAALRQQINELKGVIERNKQELDKARATADKKIIAEQQETPSEVISELDKVWAAWAIDDSNQIFVSTDLGSKVAARLAAATLCRSTSKSPSTCRTQADYSNSCLAIARLKGQPDYGDNFATYNIQDHSTAELMAIRKCEESHHGPCELRQLVCAPEKLYDLQTKAATSTNDGKTAKSHKRVSAGGNDRILQNEAP